MTVAHPIERTHQTTKKGDKKCSSIHQSELPNSNCNGNNRKEMPSLLKCDEDYKVGTMGRVNRGVERTRRAISTGDSEAIIVVVIKLVLVHAFV